MPVPVSVEDALVRAFATNEAVEWRSGARYGMVVVGPAAIENGRDCRDVAVLTRQEGAPDETLNNRRCRSGDGAILSVQSGEDASNPGTGSSLPRPDLPALQGR